MIFDNRKPSRKLKESDDSLITRYYNRDGLKPWRGCKSIKYKFNGTQSDPDLIYKGYVFNYWDIEDALWNDFLEYNGITEKYAYDGNNIRPDIENQFDQFVCDMAPSYLDDYIANGAPKNWHSKYEGYRNRGRKRNRKISESFNLNGEYKDLYNAVSLYLDSFDDETFMDEFYDIGGFVNVEKIKGFLHYTIDEIVDSMYND